MRINKLAYQETFAKQLARKRIVRDTPWNEHVLQQFSLYEVESLSFPLATIAAT